MVDKILSGPFLVLYITFITFIVAHPKDRLGYLIAGLTGVVLAVILRSKFKN